MCRGRCHRGLSVGVVLPPRDMPCSDFGIAVRGHGGTITVVMSDDCLFAINKLSTSKGKSTADLNAKQTL